SLVRQTSVNQSGFPWTLAQNADSARAYAKGACPVADDLFERSILLAIPSCLSEQDEDDIIRAFDKVLPVCAA
ncbi:MAG: DegT/DnrJ/EryC1/StrS aminotransferase, partial [Acidobacteriota bacterium]